MRLEGKVALISGGARGMGAAEARLFAREGARVAVGDLLEEEGARLESEIAEAGGDCIFIRLDVTSEESWGNAVEKTTLSRYGRLDVLVNNAGIYPEGEGRGYDPRGLGPGHGDQRGGAVSRHQGGRSPL